SMDKRSKYTKSDNVPAFIRWMEISEIQRRAVVIHSSTDKPTRIFKCRRKTGALDRESGTALRTVETEARSQRVRMKRREAAACQRLIILRHNCTEVFLGRRVDSAREGSIHPEIQADTIPNLQRITREHIESGALLLEIQRILET